MIYHLLYISETTPLYKEEKDLERILKSSRENNQKKNITGLLVKKGDFFIQVLEGKEKDVILTFNHIQPDPRHTKVRTLFTFSDSTRIFPEWAMGHADIEKNELTINELIPLLHADVLKLNNSRDKIISLLKNFNKL